MSNAEHIQGLLDHMETAMATLEGWAHPIEVEVAMQPVYHAWSLMHSAALAARSVAEQVDNEMQAVWVPKGTAAQAQEYAKNLAKETVEAT